MIKELLVKAPYEFSNHYKETLDFLKRWLDAVIINSCGSKYSLEIDEDHLYIIHPGNITMSSWSSDKNYLLGVICKAFCKFQFEMHYSHEDTNHLVFSTDMYFNNRMLNFRM